MKLVSWNVNGLRAVLNKNFRDIFNQLDADIFCLQETKLSHGQLDLSFPGYHSFWNFADKKGIAEPLSSPASCPRPILQASESTSTTMKAEP